MGFYRYILLMTDEVVFIVHQKTHATIVSYKKAYQWQCSSDSKKYEDITVTS